MNRFKKNSQTCTFKDEKIMHRNYNIGIASCVSACPVGTCEDEIIEFNKDCLNISIIIHV
ncbi:hypothetical protein HI914_07359 [Erysiphe necator]|nr:hypothetical protein HI914_07359 [Erysiphe necator]